VSAEQPQGRTQIEKPRPVRGGRGFALLSRVPLLTHLPFRVAIDRAREAADTPILAYRADAGPGLYGSGDPACQVQRVQIDDLYGWRVRDVEMTEGATLRNAPCGPFHSNKAGCSKWARSSVPSTSLGPGRAKYELASTA
jgi:hypothetical protein